MGGMDRTGVSDGTIALTDFDERWDRLYNEAVTIGLPRRYGFHTARGSEFNPRSAYAQHHTARGCDAGAHADPV